MSWFERILFVSLVASAYMLMDGFHRALMLLKPMIRAYAS